MKVKNKKETFDCNFCKKKFMRENSLINHACVKKQRWMDKDTIWSTIGFLAYDRFYKLTNSSGKKVQTHEDFINSRYYIDFIKVGRVLTDNKIVNSESYINFVIKSSIRLSDWCQEYTYERYIREIINKENPYTGIERSILYIMKWSKETNKSHEKFFENININIAANAIRGGQLSPWIIYLAPTSGKLLDRFDDSQLNLLQAHLNPQVWQIRKSRYKQECVYLKKLLKDYNF